MNHNNQYDHAFVVDTLAHLLDHLARADEEETGNKEILYLLIAKELKYRADQLLKT